MFEKLKSLFIKSDPLKIPKFDIAKAQKYQQGVMRWHDEQAQAKNQILPQPQEEQQFGALPQPSAAHPHIAGGYSDRAGQGNHCE